MSKQIKYGSNAVSDLIHGHITTEHWLDTFNYMIPLPMMISKFLLEH
jgi:hypothetical protein